MRERALAIAVAALACLVAAPALAGSVTPTKGQSAEQMQKDIAECQSVATQSSGYNPAAQPPPAAAAPPQVGGRARGAAVAGAAGAVAAGARGGEVYDNASNEAQQEYR